MPTLSANGTQLYYELTGTSDVPVVLVHGSWGDHDNWGAVVPELARSFRVLTYDRRGHSQSARPTSQGSLHEDAMDLAALLAALDMAPAHIAGNSGGAAVALRLATERPELFRSLIVHEPPLFALLAEDAAMQAPLAAVQQRIASVLELLRAGDTAGGARRFVETIAMGPGAWDALPESRRATFVTNASTFLDEQRDPDGATMDVEALRRFSAPTLLTHGEQSPPFFPAVVQQLARALPHAVQHLFVGAGHVPHVTHPQEYVDVVSGFIDGVRASAMLGDRAESERSGATLGRTG
jgi:pimeloyl-ACP methyl ester carboxylesterase